MKRTLIVLATICGLYGTAHAEEHFRGAPQGSSPGSGGGAVETLSPRQERGTREDAKTNDPSRTAFEKERKHAITIVEEALKKARERSRREAEEVRKKRLADEKQRLSRGAERATATP